MNAFDFDLQENYFLNVTAPYFIWFVTRFITFVTLEQCSLVIISWMFTLRLNIKFIKRRKFQKSEKFETIDLQEVNREYTDIQSFLCKVQTDVLAS